MLSKIHKIKIYKIDLNSFKRSMIYCQVLLCAMIKRKESCKLKANAVKADSWAPYFVISKLSKSISSGFLKYCFRAALITFFGGFSLAEIHKICWMPLAYPTVLGIEIDTHTNKSYAFPSVGQQTQKQSQYSGAGGLCFISSVAPKSLNGLITDWVGNKEGKPFVGG